MNTRHPFLFFKTIASLTLALLSVQAAAAFSESDFSAVERTARTEANTLAAAETIVQACERFLEENENADSATRLDIARATAQIARRISLTPLNAPDETTSGTPFASSFAAEISAPGATAAGVSCTARFPENGAGKTAVSAFTARAVPGRAGVFAADFAPPAPQCGVSGKLTLTPAFLTAAPLTRQLLAEFEPDTAARLTAEFPYRAMAAKNVPTVISLLDIDKNGNPQLVLSGASATALLKPVIRLGFRGTGTADFPELLAEGDEQKLYATAKAQFGGSVRRFVHGTVRVTSVEREESGYYLASLSAEISAYDFVKNEKTGFHRFSARASASTESEAIRLARETLCADTIAPALEYGM